MKFGKLLIYERVPEWAEAYIEYNFLKKLLTPAKILQKKFVSATFKDGNVVYHITNRKNLRVEEVVFCIRSFEELIKNEIIKIDKFFMYKLIDLLNRYRYLMINSSFIRSSLHSQQRIENESKLKYCFKIFYKELNMVKEYIKLNQQGLQKILKKYSKVVKSLQQTEKQDFNLVKRVHSGQDCTYLARNKDKLMSVIKKTEDNYINLFYPDISQQKMGRVDFRLYTTPKPLSSSQVLFYGIFCGISCILLLFIVLNFIQVYSEKPTAIQKTRLKSIFPLFRGNGLFITEIWMLAWNVHGWQNNHINYKLIFKFNHHFSQMYQILQRAAFFTFVYFVCFVWYILLNTPHSNTTSYEEGVNLYYLIDWIDMDLLPMFGWIILLGYTFFPFFKLSFFNPEGRQYFFNLMASCLKSPFVKMEFKIGWMTDLFVSLAGPLKDFESTICFYLNKYNALQSQCSNDNRITPFLLNIVPTIYRSLQCMRQGYDNKRFWRTWPFYNCLKYFISLSTSLLSYQYTLTSKHSVLVWWFCVGSISTVYSFYWDIAQDWGLLKIGNSWKDTKLLGRKLYYTNVKIYYFAIFSNFLLRIVWVLNQSLGLTAIIDDALNVPGLFKLVVYFLEIYRRCQWNFFRVELEHINNCNKYKAVVDLDLPIQIDVNSQKSAQQPIQTSNQLMTVQTEMLELKVTENNIEDIDIESNRKNNQNKDLLSPNQHNIIFNLQVNGVPQNELKSDQHLEPDIFQQNNTNNNQGHQHRLSSMGTTGDILKFSNVLIASNKGKLNLNDGINEEDNVKIQKRANNDIQNQLNEYQNQKYQKEDKVIETNDTSITSKDKTLSDSFKREQEKIAATLIQFQEQLKRGITSEKTKKAVQTLKKIKPFLKNEYVNQVQIQSQMLTYLDDEEASLKA